MTGGWLRRNAIALVAVVVLVPATLGVTFSNEWVRYYSSRPSQPVVVDSGAEADFAGTGWRVDSTRRIASTSPEGEAARLPAGSDLVVVTVDVTPRELDENGASPYCELRLEEQGGGELARNWGDAAFDPIDYEGAEGVESGCTTDLTSPYQLEALFVIPSTVDSALAMHLEVGDQLPRYLSLRL
ncbi:hypothetical protein B7R54_07340 [Subtercola boreus]|uniref:DUF4352 domain-containing protein n=1 Tax=Subtercola boreus TaxID=120213 RepID=A0A3E0VHC1_9MICO|nr:hypothetical protein [Subtercola boreus]RFA09059.1 hypothetical protein B7R54_07340 [Subtercola boreus]TQL53941.1 hypothetical protein FB464_1461 [Subtercola boreus]